MGWIKKLLAAALVILLLTGLATGPVGHIGGPPITTDEEPTPTPSGDSDEHT